MTSMLALPATTMNTRPLSALATTALTGARDAAADVTVERYWLDDGTRLVPVGVIDGRSGWYLDRDAALQALVRPAPPIGADLYAEGRYFTDAEALGRALGLNFARHPQTRSLTMHEAHPARAATLGLAYPLGARRPLSFTLGGAAYSLDRVETGGSIVAPDAGEKLLLVRCTVLNTHRAAQVLAPHTLSLEIEVPILRPIAPSAVWCARGEMSAHLAPNERAEVTAAFLLPSGAHVSCLSVRRDMDGETLQYALGEVIEPLRAAHADRRDRRGLTPLTELPGRPGVMTPLRTLDVRVEGVTPLTGGPRAATGTRAVAATVTVRNARSSAVYLGLSTLGVTLRAQGGREIQMRDVLEGERDTTAARTLGAGESVQVRYVFEAPVSWPVEAVSVREGNSRLVTYTVGRAT